MCHAGAFYHHLSVPRLSHNSFRYHVQIITSYANEYIFTSAPVDLLLSGFIRLNFHKDVEQYLVKTSLLVPGLSEKAVLLQFLLQCSVFTLCLVEVVPLSPELRSFVINECLILSSAFFFIYMTHSSAA